MGKNEHNLGMDPPARSRQGSNNYGKLNYVDNSRNQSLSYLMTGSK